MIRYEKLWYQLKMRDMSQYYLIKYCGISPSQLTRLKRNLGVSTHTLNTFCRILNCSLDDIAEYIRDDSPIRPRRKSSSKRAGTNNKLSKIPRIKKEG